MVRIKGTTCTEIDFYQGVRSFKSMSCLGFFKKSHVIVSEYKHLSYYIRSVLGFFFNSCHVTILKVLGKL